MLTKDSLRKEFARDWKTHYDIRLFREKGFSRKQCACGKHFWTLDPDRAACGSEEPYSFIGRPATKKKLDYIETWKAFEKYFVKEGHTSIKRYPVIDRWRPDLYFTIASIQDFQRIDKGRMVFVYPANPLIVPQVCLRFPDIQNVGVTGRHHTSFVMPGQHAFGWPAAGYFKDRCLELDFGFLHSALGVPETDLTYIEDIWAMPDFSAFGPCIEAFSRGLELVNHVFMQFTKAGAPRGYADLDLTVNDTGWGLERLAWFSQGTATGYEAVFGPVLEWMQKQAGWAATEAFTRYAAIASRLDFEDAASATQAKEQIARQLGITLPELDTLVSPVQALAAIADHTRTLLFALTDGAIPSNAGGGYNLRVLLRRSLAFLQQHQFPFDLLAVAERHVKFLKPLFPELKEGLEFFPKILEVEQDRYQKTLEKGRAVVLACLEKDLDTRKLVTLYTSHGITPELVQEIAAAAGKPFSVPADFYQQLTEAHAAGKKGPEEETKPLNVSAYPETKPLFYDDPFLFSADARVLGSISDSLILDQTVFYPEGGGQPCDLGFLSFGGRSFPVLDVQKVGEVILHKVKDASRIPPQSTIRCEVDPGRRTQLTRMHDATHLVGGCARRLFGNHVWQSGAQKGLGHSRLDLTHYEPFTTADLQAIERLANETIRKNLPVHSAFLERGEAEGKYGFILYQGGASPGSRVRVVDIGNGFDTQACGGTHGRRLEEIGSVKVIKTERVQDGVNRITFTCGPAADAFLAAQQDIFQHVLRHAKRREELIQPAAAVESRGFDYWQLLEACAVFSVEPAQFPKTMERFVQEIAEMEDVLAGIGSEPELPVSRPMQSLPALADYVFSYWKNLKKKNEEQTAAAAGKRAAQLLPKVQNKIVFDILDANRQLLLATAGHILALDPAVTVILANPKGEVLCASKARDAGQFLKEIVSQCSGSGGGSKELAQGRAEISKLIKVMERYQHP